MAEDRQIAFGSFRFAPRTGQLWRDDAEVKLTPRAAAVLLRLVERAQEIVTKEELFDHVWGGMAVTDDALTSCIRELRGALDDDARRPRYIETRHRRGFRLMIPVGPVAGQTGAAPASQAGSPQPTPLVGRVAELQELMRRFDRARRGRRQMVFVTGEPGIGKSSLADAFLAQLRTTHAVQIAHGQCLDHHGVGEPYLPLIEALTRLALAKDGAPVKAILSAQAPSWVAQMPALWGHSDRASLQRRGRATSDRMVRELTQAVEEIAADVPLLIKIEDIHWSDASTLDWLAHVARRLDVTRLMVMATFRPGDAAGAKVGLNSLVAELALHGWCCEVALNPLTLQEIETYLASQLQHPAGELQPRHIASLLLERTGGNPLFMASIVGELTQRQDARPTLKIIQSIPHDVRRFIEQQIDQLSASDRDVLMAASTVGREFATVAVAAALESDVEAVEAASAHLARQGVFAVKSGSIVWPDRTGTELYSFRHDLYRELLYDRIPASRRATSHGRIGRRLESAWAGRLDAIASELAEHFERANQPARAIPHHQRAAAKALRRSANAEAIRHLHRALDGVGAINDEVERVRVEVELLVALGAAYIAAHGFSAPEVLDAYTRAEALCERLGQRADLFPAIWGQWLFRTGRSETDAARRLCTRLLALADKFDDPALKIQAHHAMWSTSLVCGELGNSLSHALAALKLFDPKLHQAMASSYGNHDAGCCARNFSAMSLALAGDQHGARAMIEELIAAAKNLDDPFTLALTLFFTSAAAHILGDVAFADTHSRLSVQIATEHDLAQPRAWSMGVAGWCTAVNGQLEHGLSLATQAIADMRTIQSRHFLPYLLGLLADVYLKAERLTEGLTTVDEAFATAEATGEQFYSAELHRLRGELLARMPGPRQQVEAPFRTAIELARHQRATVLEQRARESLRRWCL